MSNPRRFADVCFQDPKYDRFKRMNLEIAEERKAQASAPPLPKVEPKVEVKEREVKGDPIQAGDINPGTKVKIERLDQFKKTVNWNGRGDFDPTEMKRAMSNSLHEFLATQERMMRRQEDALRHWKATVPTPVKVVVTDTGKKDKETPREGAQAPARGVSLARLPFYRSLSSLSLPALNKKNLCFFVAVLVVTGLVMYQAYHHHDLGTETAKVDIMLNCPPETDGLVDSMVTGATRAFNRVTFHMFSAHAPDMSVCKSAMAKIQINQRYSFPLLDSIWHAFASLLETPFQALCNLVWNAVKYPFQIIGSDIAYVVKVIFSGSIPVAIILYLLNHYDVSGKKWKILKRVIEVGHFVYQCAPAAVYVMWNAISSNGEVATPLN